MYKLTSSESVLRLEDGAVVPADERNADWRAYQDWLVGGNMPALADQPSAADLIKKQIADLEATVTPRRIREAVLGTDGGWLAALNAQIVTLRAKLTV